MNDHLYDSYYSEQALHTRSLSPADSRDYYASRVLKWLPNDRSAVILDLGCGIGDLVQILADCGYTSATGVDASREMIEESHRRGNARTVLAQAKPHLDTLQDRSLDVIIASHVFEHFSKNDLIDLMGVISRKLSPSGRLIVLVPNAGSPLGLPFAFGDFTHEIFFTSTSLGQLATMCGMQAIAVEGARPSRRGVKGFFKSLVWALERRALRLVLGNPKARFSNVYEQEIIGVFTPKPV